MRNLFKTIASAVLMLLPMLSNAEAQTPVSYFGALPDLKVSGKEFVDPTGKAVTLHGVMDTPNDYFNGGRWNDGTLGWPVYQNERAVTLCLNYFTKVFQAIANPAKGTYCNLFRLHLDPAWTNDPNKTATNGGGENDISRFSADRLRTYMNVLYVPIVEDALAHGLYVIMRPPGVFPEDVTIGDAYNDYLFTVWDIVSSNEYVKAHAGQIMLELGNEPVRMSGYLADYFQPIVNKIRQNGFTGILLLPGTSYQADYRSYNTKPIEDNNFGYAVHNYPGWYGGWDANQTEANFISTFEAQVPVDKKPIVITEVDWSPMKEGAGHWNEMHTQYTEGNFGTWATGTTNSPAPNVPYKNTQNVGWGMRFKHLVDKHPNISWTLQGTTTYVDMDKYLEDATVRPAFTKQMQEAGYADASEACSKTCFEWYYQYACGDRIPYGTPDVLPEESFTPTYKTNATTVGNAYFDKTNRHYIFYTPTNSAFIFKEFSGKTLSSCKTLTIDLGEGSTIGYRLDVQLKDANGNIIKDGTDDYIIGTEARGSKAEDKVFDMQERYATYITNYPGCTLGDIRLNTVVDWGQDDTDKTGKHWFTIDKMEMTYKKTFPAGNQYYDQTDGKYYFFEPYGCSFSFDQFAGKKAMLCDELTIHCDQNQSTIGYRLDIYVTDPSGAAITTHYINAYGQEATETNLVIGEESKGTRFTEPTGDKTYNIQKILKDVLREHPDAIIGNIRINTVVSTSDANREGLYYIKMTGMSMTEAPEHRVEVSTERITEEVKDLSEFTMYDYLNSKEIKANLQLGTEVAAGAEVYGDGTGNVFWKNWADLTGYTKMTITGTGGELRVMFNRQTDGGNDYIELKPNLSTGSAVLDLSSYSEIHLHTIKVQWNNTAKVTSIKLSKQIDSAPAPFDVDYYFYGDGSLKGEANFALQDENVTIIDIQGMTNTEKINSIESANPNCLFIYNNDDKVNAYGGNFVKNNSWGYSAWRINLSDGYDYNAPVGILTAAQNYDNANPYGATYTRDLGTNSWATIALPFDMNVAESPEAYVLTGSQDGELVFSKPTGETIPAGTVILYYNEQGGNTSLKGKDIAKTPDGFNIQPVPGVNGWYTAQSFKHQVIDDVTADPVLRDYDIYGISGGKFIKATKKLTLRPFRAFFLCQKNNPHAASLRIRIAGNEEEGIQQVTNDEIATECDRYDASGRRILSPTPGVNLIRMTDGSVRRVFIR